MGPPSVPQVVLLREWEPTFLPGLHLNPEERALADQLGAGPEARLRIDSLRDGTRIVASSWVGVVRFEHLEIRVAPKLAGGTLGIVEMIEFATGLASLRRIPADRLLSTEEGGLFDLIALLLVEATDSVVRSGPFRDYREREEEIGVVRGRLLVEQQVLRRFGRLDRLVCRFDEQEYDILENQILAAALSRCATYATHESIRRRAHLLNGLFRQLCDPAALDVAAAEHDLHYHRLNEHYREAHTIAFLVLKGLGIRDILAVGRTRSFAFLLDMNPLFERFVLRLIQYAMPTSGYQVQYQRGERSVLWNADTDKPYARVVPDILVNPLSSRQTQVAVDAKYKLYSDAKVASSDIYQAFLYAHAFSGPRSATLPGALLVFPSSAVSADWLRLQVRDSARMPIAEITALGISIPGALEEVRLSKHGVVTNALAEAIRRTTR